MAKEIGKKNKKEDKVRYNKDGVADTVPEQAPEIEEDDQDGGMFSTVYDDEEQIVWKGVSYETYENWSTDRQEQYRKDFSNALNSSEDYVPDMTEDTTIQPPYSGSKSDIVTEVCLEYNEKIPFAYEGRSYALGFEKHDSFDNSQYQETLGYGLDNLGYIIWLFRNVMGKTPKELKGDFSLENLKHEINIQELQIGDLCVYQKGDAFLIGVVAGFSSDNAIISMCDNIPSKQFTYGCVHMCYIQKQKDEFLDIYKAVPFENFYRLDCFSED